MNKIIFSLLLLAFSTSLYSQKYFTRTGKVEFNASTAGFEPIEAVNANSSALLDTTNGELAILSLVKGFKFDIALMQEHFNESYAESSKYPKATFKGKIKDFKLADVTKTPKVFKINGTLDFHGKQKKIENRLVKIYQEGNEIIIDGELKVSPSEFDVKVPGSVRNKVSDKVTIIYYLALKKKS